MTRTLSLFCFCVCIFRASVAASEVRENVPIPMRDGVKLAADVYLPDGSGPFPVLLSRTPYDKTRGRDRAERLMRHGYGVVIVDSRGIYQSEGEWRPYVTEADDGYDTQEWIGRQSWCDGTIGMFGTSYPGFTQLLPAPQRSEYVKAIVPVAAQSDNYGSIWYTDGLYHLALALRWGASQAALAAGGARPDVNWMPLMMHLPVKDALGQLGLESPFVSQTLEHETYDNFWRKMSIRHLYHEMDVPAFHITGWYDALVHETIVNFTNMRATSRSAHARRWQKLLIGPWGHGFPRSSRYGDVDFGSGALIDVDGLHLRWYDYHLKGSENGLDAEAPIRIFVMGDNVWRDEEAWPIERVQPTRFYLRSDGAANTRFGDGGLSRAPPGEDRPDTYRYDPRNPVPTYGGSGCCGGGLTPHGPRDQSVNQQRQDVLVYATEPLTDDLEVTGAIELRLFFETNVPDTDFFATVSDVYPDGRAILIAEGMVRTRYRDSVKEPRWLEPNETHEVVVAFWETSNVFKAGHRVRLHVTSTNFPRFDRNLNAAKPVGEGTEADITVATHRIHHDEKHPSSLLLPVVPR